MKNPIFFLVEPPLTVFLFAAGSPEASLGFLCVLSGGPVALCCRLTSTDHSNDAPCPVVLVPLTSSPGCRPQIGNYLLSEP